MRTHRMPVAIFMFVVLIGIGFGQDKRRAEPFKYPLSVTEQVVGNCGTFDILTDWVAMVVGNVIYDKDGEAVQKIELFRVIGQSIYYNSENPDLFLTGGPGESGLGRYDLQNGILYIGGINFKVRVPGYGPVYYETGHAVMDLETGEVLFNSGHNQALGQDLEALCKFLTPIP